MTAPISVVIPCYRCSDTIERAVVSIEKQTLQPSEIILVDDCSGDNTLAKLRDLSENRCGSIKVIAMERNSGPSAARNAGWNMANEKYVAFLDADDTWHPLKLETQFRWMEENPAYTLTGHKCLYDAAGGHPAKSFTTSNDMEATFRTIKLHDLLLKNYFSTQTVMIKRDSPFRFLESKKYCEDYLLACEICASGAACAASNAVLAFLHKEAYGAGGLSGDLWRMWKGELEVYKLLRRTKSIPLIAVLFYSSFSFARFLRRNIKVLLRRIRGLN